MNSEFREEYLRLLEKAVGFHGHKCAGIEIGTRMTMCGLRRVGITDPNGADRKNLIVYVEIDRCATDAITALTGCRPGKRSMKVLDYGKMAATFINIESGKAVRISPSKNRTAHGADQELPDFSVVKDEEFFSIQEVHVDLRPEDLPGKPVRSAICSACGDRIMDGREIESDGMALCKPCAEGSTYYEMTE